MNPQLASLEELQKLPLYELISLLDDVQAPQPVSYFPVTPVWTWIFWVTLLIVAFVGRSAWKRWHKERYRTLACREFERLAEVKGPAYVMKVSQILKKAALDAYPRTCVASLQGQDWLDFLDRTYDGTEFTQGIGQTLALSPYQRHADINQDALGSLAKKWIRTHQRGYHD